MRKIILILMLCGTVFGGSLLEKVCEFRDGLVHRPSCGWNRHEACVWQCGGGTMLDLAMAFKSMMEREGIESRLVLGRVSLSMEQVKAWLPWEAGKGLPLDVFGDGNNGCQMADGRFAFDMAWVRCHVQYAPDFGTSESLEEGGRQWVNMFPALIGCEKAHKSESIFPQEEIVALRKMLNEKAQFDVLENDKVCSGFPVEDLLERRKTLVQRLMKMGTEDAELYGSDDIPGYRNRYALGIHPVCILEEYGEYDEMPEKYITKVIVDIIRNDRIVCQLTIPQVDVQSVDLQWIDVLNGKALSLENGQNCSQKKAYPQLISGDVKAIGQGAFALGEPFTVRFRRMLGDTVLDEIRDYGGCGGRVGYGLSLRHDEVNIDDMIMTWNEKMACLARHWHDMARRQAMGVLGKCDVDGLALSKVEQGVRWTDDIGKTVAGYYIGVGELGEGTHLDFEEKNIHLFILRSVMADISGVILDMFQKNLKKQSPWSSVLDMLSDGKNIFINKHLAIENNAVIDMMKEGMIGDSGCWVGENTGLMQLGDGGMVWQSVFMELQDKVDISTMQERISLLSDDLSLTRCILLVLRELDGDINWLEDDGTGRLAVLGMFYQLDELRKLCPRIEEFSVEPSSFQRDKTFIKLKASSGENWTIHIKNGQNAIVRSYHGEGCETMVNWDGCDENGNICQDGQYEFFGSVSSNGFQDTQEIKGIMDSTRPIVQLVSWLEKNDDGNVLLRGEYLIEEEDLALIAASLYDLTDGKLLKEWDLKEKHGKVMFDFGVVEDGVYELMVEAEDKASNRAITSNVLTVGVYSNGDIWKQNEPEGKDVVTAGVVAEIIDPMDGDQMKDMVIKVFGTAKSEDGDTRYMLRLWDTLGNLLPCAAEERSQGWLLKYIQNSIEDDNLAYRIPTRKNLVSNDLLGLLDVSGLSNGRYRLELVVTGEKGVSTSVRDIYFEKAIQQGVFEFTETDGKVLFGGMEVKLQRSYSSGELRDGEMGFGWTWSFSSTGGEIDDERETVIDAVGNMVSVRSSGSRDVSLTLPDGRRCTYRFNLDEGGGWSFCYYAVWCAPSGVKATLRPVVSNKLMVLPGMEPYWEAVGNECDWECYDFPGFILTDVDGTEYEYERVPLGEAVMVHDDGGSSIVDCYGDLQLRQIRKRNGESWRLDDKEITHIQRDGSRKTVLQMERDEMGRIIEIVLDTGNKLRYEYDAVGNLASVVQDSSGERKTMRHYKYENARFPHHLTGIENGRGICLMAMEYNELGEYCGLHNADGASATAVRDSLDGYELQTDCYGHETLFGYDNAGRITLKIEADGGRTQVEYDAEGHEVKRTDPLGRVITQVFDSQGNLTSRRTGGGDVTKYVYNSEGQCVRQIDAMGRMMTAEYDSSGHANMVSAPGGAVLRRQFGKNGELEAEMDENGEKLAIYEHDSNGRVTAMTDFVGGTRQEYLYDSTGRVSELKQQGFNPQTNDVETFGVFYERDADGNVISSHDSLGDWTQIVRDGAGNVAERRTSYGQHQRYRYNVTGRCVEEIDVQKSLVVRYVYDIGGRLIMQTEPETAVLINGSAVEKMTFGTAWMLGYDVTGRENSRIRRRNAQIRLVQVSEDCYRTELESVGDIVTGELTEYDLAGQVTRRVSALGYSMKYTYDGNGNCTSETDHYGNCEWREFNGIGNIVRQVDALGHETRMDYDKFGRLRGVHWPDGNEWSLLQDCQGRVLEQTDGEGGKTFYDYDLGNSPTAVQLPELEGHAYSYTYQYDSRGCFVSVTDPLVRERRYERDDWGRVVMETSPLGRVEKYRYLGRSSQLTERTEASGRRMEWSYDELGRVSEMRAWKARNEGEADIKVEHFYDDYGRLIRLEASEGVLEYSYNIDGKLVAESENGRMKWVADTDEEGGVVKLAADGLEMDFMRGQHGRLDGMAVYAVDGLESVDGWEVVYDFNACRQVMQSVTTDGWTKNYDYDACGRCVGVEIRMGGELVYSSRCQLDGNGRRVKAVEMEDDATKTWSWKYDAWGRLVEEHLEMSKDTEDRNWHGNYDAVGNLSSEEWRIRDNLISRRSYQMNDDDQIVKMVDDDENGHCETQFEWNENGELIRMETKGNKHETREWTWSAVGHLEGMVIVTPEKRTEISFEYDLAGILRRQHIRFNEKGKISELEREFCFETVTRQGVAQLLEMKETSDGVSTLTSYFYGMGLEGMVKDGTICHVWSDSKGWIRGMASGDQIERYTYNTWGVNDDGHNGFGYAGEWQDEASGLVYLRGRFYWPWIRRFISVDRHPADFKRPQTWHRYAYCLNDPVNGRDANGEFAMTATMALTLKLAALYVGVKLATTAYYDIYHAKMMQDMLDIRKKYHDEATVVVHGVTEHEVNWSESFSDTLESLSGNQDMYEFLWSGFQSGGFVLFIPNPLSHRIATLSLTYFLLELSMRGYLNVNVIAHSWGTVLSRDAMNLSCLSYGLWATMGSPLGWTFPTFGFRKWQNYYSPADGVIDLAPLLKIMGYNSNDVPLYTQLTKVEQHATWCLNPVAAHSSYWTDPCVLNDLLTALKWH
ncbi:MAG: hypothetical protein J6X49_12740 [Victivallales bacterium]|nr:hypothetical protein [Victivallales bacterium]